MKIGENIAMLRRKKGVTQAQLADELHFTRQAISNWERGQTEPDAQTLPVLAAYFGVSTDELLGACPASHPLPPSDSLPASPKRRLEVQMTVPAAKALRVLLLLYIALYASDVLFSFPASSPVYLFFGNLCGIFSSAAQIAVFILFFAAKKLSGNVAVLISFVVCIVTDIVFSFFLFSQNAALVLAGIILSACAKPVAMVLMPFVFRTASYSSARRRYFILFGAMLAITITAIATDAAAPRVPALSPAFYHYLPSVSAFLTLCADTLYAAALLFLERILVPRTADPPFLAETSDRMRNDFPTAGIAAFSEQTPKNIGEEIVQTERPIFQKFTFLYSFCLCFVLPLTAFFIQSGTNISIEFSTVFAFSPALFGVLFCIGKKGKHPALTIAVAVFWCANLLYGYYLLSFYMIAPSSPIHTLHAAETYPNFLIWPILCTAVLFGFKSKKSVPRSAGIAVRCFLLAFACAATAAGLCFVIAVDSDLAPVISFFLTYIFLLLLFIAHFLIADRTVRTTVLYGGANSSKAGTASPKQ